MPSTELGFWGELFMLQVVLNAPALGIVAYIRIRRGKSLPPKRKRYARALIGQFAFLFLALAAAREEHVAILAGPLPSFTTWIFTAAVLGMMALRLRSAWRRLSPERKRRASLFLPDDYSQMRLWVGVSAMAGISEEIAYRGLAFKFLSDNHGAVWFALAICVITFAVAHAFQGLRGVLATAIIALLMHAIVFLTGSLYLAITIHAVYDLMVGVIALPILAELAKSQPLPQLPEAASNASTA